MLLDWTKIQVTDTTVKTFQTVLIGTLETAWIALTFVSDEEFFFMVFDIQRELQIHRLFIRYWI